MRLIGRQDECALLDRTLDTARQGLSATLVIRGDAGIGKTALIDYAVDAADDFLVIRLTGVESESEIAFAALHRLLVPHLDQIRHLPPPQRNALNCALGLTEGSAADLFLVGLATMSLAARIARTTRQLLCVVDDVQWIDRESIATLAFWGRRVDSDGAVLIFGERAGTGSGALHGFDVLELRGLTGPAANELLRTVADTTLDVGVIERIVADTTGNPLALVEFAKDVDEHLLLDATATEQPLPLSALLQDRYGRQIRALAADTQMFLLIVAADSTGDLALVTEAAAALGVAVDAAEQAETRGLITMGTRIEFRHPLIRAAVYSAARPTDRRAVHRALAEVTDIERDANRRAWHLAAATIGHDEAVASTLERCADVAGSRGGFTTEMAFLTRAAELTPDSELAAARLLAAADAAFRGNLVRQTRELVARASPHLRSAAQRAVAQRLDGCAVYATGLTDIAAPLLLAAARALVDSDPALTRRTLLLTLQASFVVGGDRNEACRQATEGAARTALEGSANDDGVIGHLLTALATYAESGYVAAVPLMRHALLRMTDESVHAEHIVPWVIEASVCARGLWDHDLFDAVMTRAARRSREHGELYPFVVSLQASAESAMWAGRFDDADRYLAQSDDISSALGKAEVGRQLMQTILAGHRGNEAVVRSTASFVVGSVAQVGLGVAALRTHASQAELCVGFGRYEEALACTSVVFARDPFVVGGDILPNMIEAAIRVGDLAAANLAMERLTERATASGTPWALGLLARSQALLAGDDAEPLYQAAIDLFARTRLAIELARSHLVYGEWLRRQNRRLDARGQLRIAADMFATMGSKAFASRANAELLATGEHARKRTVETANVLTPRESHIAQLAADGHTNSEIAAQLFIGSNTVDYHLRKVFRKLSVTSRRQLKLVMATH